MGIGLGTKKGSKGKYSQAREYGDKGELIRDVDFTDHGRPHNHPCPHQHSGIITRLVDQKIEIRKLN